jgi:hypothetical protein
MGNCCSLQLASKAQVNPGGAVASSATASPPGLRLDHRGANRGLVKWRTNPAAPTLVRVTSSFARATPPDADL